MSLEEIEFDVGKLLVSDPTPLDMSTFNENPEECIKDMTKTHLHTLINKVYQLPKISDNEGVYVTLPSEDIKETRLPREKPIPVPKKEPHWKKFVKQKGLKFQPRDFWKYDEETDEFRPRVGLGSKKGKKEWVVEDKPKINPMDPFGKGKGKKRKNPQITRKVQPNKRRKLTELNEVGLVTQKLHPKFLPNYAKSTVSNTLDIARISTSSMGKFDKKIRGEKRHEVGVIEPKKRLTTSERDGLLRRIVKESENKKMTRTDSTNIWQRTFEKRSVREKKKAVFEQAKMKYKVRTKKRGGKKRKKKF